MLPRRKRLSRASFPTHGGLKAASPAFSLSFGPSTKGGCAAVVSKAVARRSADRHLLKRRMLSVMEAWHAPGRYLVAYARGPAAKLSFRQISSELTELLVKTTNR